MPFSDPLCAQYSLSVIKNCHAATGVFFVLSDGQKEKSSSANSLYQTAPRLSIRCPRPLRGRPPSPIRETPRSREPHIRERPPPLVSFLVARDPPLGHTPGAPPRQLRPASPQESAPKPSQKHPQSPKKPSDKPQKPSDKPHPQNVPKIPQKTA